MQLAVAAKAVNCVGFGLNLHARSFIGMERAAYHFIAVGLNILMPQYRKDRKLGFYFCYFHFSMTFCESYGSKSFGNWQVRTG